ncbi:MAG: hypothetical protein ACW964_19540 [Candidatus Hodarchaeales archaeon]|jgi:hypothetical protein
MKSRKKLLIISMTILASLILSGFPIMPTGTSASVASLGDDHSEDFEGIVFPSWTATGLWHLEDNSTSSYPIYGWMPSVTRYMWYGSNTTGTYNTTDPFSAGELISDQVDLSGFFIWNSGVGQLQKIPLALIEKVSQFHLMGAQHGTMCLMYLIRLIGQIISLIFQDIIVLHLELNSLSIQPTM